MAFIFDFDGTLVDSMPFWEHIGQIYLEQQGIPADDFDLTRKLRTMGMQESAVYFRERYQLAQSPEQIITEVNALVAEAYHTKIPLKAGVLPFLQAHADEKMVIATALDATLVQVAIERLGIASYFMGVITSDMVGNSKQYPDIYHKATAMLGASQEDVVVFEDAPHAMRTAKQAGYKVVGVREAVFDTQVNRTDCDQFVCNLMETTL